MLSSQRPLTSDKPWIVSLTHPKDSRGETVYDERDEIHKNIPAIPGVFIYPRLVKQVKPTIPFSTRVHHRKLRVGIEFVVAANGDVIDVTVTKPDLDRAYADSVVKAISQYRFEPETLDGQPIAVLVETEFTCNIF